MNHADDPLACAVDEFFERVEAGETPSPFDFADTLGADFADFLRAVEARSALHAVIDPAPPVDQPSELGPYTLSRKLGHGGGGAVYEARDARSGARVALKLIHAGFSENEARVRRFRREGRLGVRVRHPHLVEVLETGAIDDRLYCAMELVDGPTLRQRLRDGPLPATPANLGQFAGIADGLAAIHAAGGVHRDVKPSNILIGADGRFRLGDFGLVRITLETTITQTGEVLGTIGYMSPEQFQADDDAIDARSDLYALGATLFEAFAGQPAIKGPSISSMVRAAHAPSPPDPRALQPALSPGLATVIRTAMERRPEDRYQTAEMLRDDLRRLAAGRSVVAHPLPPLRRWVRRRPRTAAATAALIVAAAATGIHLATRPAVVVVESNPSAAVLVDGRLHARATPARLELAPGDYEIRLQRKRFRPLRFPLTLERGSNPTRVHTLLPIDAADRESMEELARSLGYEAEPFDASTQRGARGQPAGLALLPRGRCRPVDLDSLRFETSDEEPFPQPATLVIRRGEEVLHQRTIEDVDLVAELPFPAEVRDRLHVGDTVVWGVAGFETTIEIVEESAGLRAELARLDRRLQGARANVRMFLRSLAFFKHGLPMAAYREAGGGTGVLSVGTRLRALRALGAVESRLGDALRDAVGALPVAEQTAWFR